MRGSPFQEKSALEAIRQNEQYLRHRRRVDTISLSPRVLPDGQALLQHMRDKSHKIRTHRISQEEKAIHEENMRMLRQILVIRQGKALSVNKADEWLSRPKVVKDRARSHRFRSIEEDNKKLCG